MKVINNKDIDDEYKYNNSHDHNSNVSLIKINKEEEELVEIFMSMDLPRKVVNHMIVTIRSCGKNMIELEKQNKKY